MKNLIVLLLLVCAGVSSIAQSQRQPGTVLIPNTGVRKYYYYSDEFEKSVKKAGFNLATVEKIREEIERFRKRLTIYQSSKNISFEDYAKKERDQVWLLSSEAIYHENIRCGFGGYEKCLKKSRDRQTEIENSYKLGVKPFDINRVVAN